MSPFDFQSLPGWAAALSLGLHLTAGVGLGVLYFQGVRWSAHRFVEGGHTGTTVALTIGRFFLLGGLLTGASLEGAVPLLTMAVGLLAARVGVMRQVQVTAP